MDMTGIGLGIMMILFGVCALIIGCMNSVSSVNITGIMLIGAGVAVLIYTFVGIRMEMIALATVSFVQK